MRVIQRSLTTGLLLGALVLGLVVLLASCGGSTSTTTQSPPASAPATTAAPTTATTGATQTTVPPVEGGTASSVAGSTTTVAFTGEEAAIAEVWTKFFDGKQPVKDKVALLEDGDKYSKELDLNASSTMATQSSAQVTAIKLNSDTNATVTYTILLSGQPALPNVQGEAVKQNGTWKVSAKSFLALLALQGVSVPST